jgi:hypothetical protein
MPLKSHSQAAIYGFVDIAFNFRKWRHKAIMRIYQSASWISGANIFPGFSWTHNQTAITVRNIEPAGGGRELFFFQLRRD